LSANNNVDFELFRGEIHGLLRKMSLQ